MRKYDFFWATNEDWYDWTEEGDRIIKPDAPPEAQESWKRYRQQKKRASEDMKNYKCFD